MPYSKPWLSYEQQLAQLKERGLTVTDDAAAIDYLERLGYYRLSAYWYPFRVVEIEKSRETGKNEKYTTDNFLPGATLEVAAQLYVFDKKLRMLALDALERIEVAVRVDIAHLLGRHDPFAYMKPDLLRNEFANKVRENGTTAYAEWMDKFNGTLARSKEPFVTHCRDKYGLPLPIWIAIELWDFGLLSRFFSGMLQKDQRAIAAKYGIEDSWVLVSWLRSLNYLRNICAHHCRLWNRNMVERARLPDQGQIPDFDRFLEQPNLLARPFVFFCLVQWMMKQVCPQSSWATRFKDLLGSFPVKGIDRVTLKNMGCLDGWEEWELWTA